MTVIDELYGAYSVIERLQHNGVWYRAVEVEWVYRERPQPIAPYATLIADYGQLDGPERTCAEQYMDEHFTAAEFDLLRRYMERRYGLDVDMSVIPIPMEVEPETVGFMATPARRMVEADQSGKFGWYPLDDPEEALPFGVMGWYFVGESAGVVALAANGSD
jgi:hypothetical protein